MDLRAWRGDVRGVVILIALVGPLAALGWAQAAVYRSADAVWQATLAVNPSCWTAHEHLAASLERQGRVDEAIAHYEQALALQPASAEAHLNLGELEMDAGDGSRLVDAAAHFQTAIRLQPKAAVAHSNLGLAWLRMGRVQDAIREQRLALAMQPDLGEVHCHLALALQSAGDGDQSAVEEHACALGDPPTARRLASALKEQGDALSRLGYLRDAVADYQRALRLLPDFAQAGDGLAQALDRIRRGE